MLPTPFPHVRRLHPLQRLAVGLWLLLVAGVVGRVAVARADSGTVVPVYRAAADRWLAGESLYAPQPGLDVYRNPPGVAPLFVPLTWVPPKVGAIAWRLAGAGLFLAGFAAWLRHGLPLRLDAGQTGAAFALAVPLALPSLNNGQINLHLAGLLLLGTTAVARGRFRAGGLLLAAAAGLKVYPLAVGLLLAAAFPRRLLPWLLAGVAACVAFPFACQSHEYVAATYRDFAGYLGSDDRSHAELIRAPRDLFLLLRVWAAAPPADTYLAFQLAAAAGMAGWVAVAARRAASAPAVTALAFDLGCVWMTVLGPATEVHTYTLLAPTAAVAVVLAYPRGSARFALALLAWGLLTAPIVRDAFPAGWRFQAWGPLPAGGCVLLAVVLARRTRDTRHETREKGRTPAVLSRVSRPVSRVLSPPAPCRLRAGRP